MLYIHIPFCEQKCNYCAFTSLAIKDYEKPYFKALCSDISFSLNKFNIKALNSVFIGGGTPSLINAKFYAEIFNLIKPFLSKNAEISVEANPNSANLAWLKEMKSFGVNRISFGAQSFNEKKLKFLGRIHGANEIYKALKNARKAGFKNVNLDLIYDSKMDNKKMLDFELENLKNVLSLITHLSAYNLTIEANTAFANKFSYKKNAPYLMKYFIENIKNLGFFQYEISNFAKTHPKNKFECKHNLSYWRGKNYLGCGFGAVGFYQNQRFYTKSNLNEYISEPNFRKIEFLSEENLGLERIFLGLRSKVGIKKKFLSETCLKKAEILLKEKKLSFKNGTFFNENYLISDEIALFLNA